MASIVLTQYNHVRMMQSADRGFKLAVLFIYNQYVLEVLVTLLLDRRYGAAQCIHGSFGDGNDAYSHGAFWVFLLKIGT